MSSLVLNPSMQDAIFNGGSCQLYWNQEKIWPTGIVLPAKTLRYRFTDPDLDPTTLTLNGWTWTKVQNSSYNDWDMYRSNNSWNGGPFDTSTKLRTDIGYYSIIAAGDTSSVTSFESFFGFPEGYGTQNGFTPSSVVPIDTSGATILAMMFHKCNRITSIPSIDISSIRVTPFSNVGLYKFAEDTSIMSVPIFTGTEIIDVDLSFILNRAFAGCTQLRDISNLSTLRVVYSGGNIGSNSGIRVDSMFANIPSPLFSISGNEFNGTGSKLKSLSYLFDGSGLPTGWQNVFSWPTITGATYNEIARNKSLVSIPTIPTISSITPNFTYAFANNPDVSTGMLAAYNVLSSASTPLGTNCFYGTGTNTAQGMADRAQIPTSWGGDYVVQDLYVGTGWSKWKNSSSLGTLWQCTSYNVDFSTLQSMQIYTESSISSYAGVNMRKTNIGCRRGNFSNSSSSPCYYWPAFMQFSGNGGASDLIWILVSTGYNGTLGAGSSSGDMPGTLSYNNFGNHSVQIGTYVPNYDKPTGFGFLVTNSDTLDSSCLTNFGILYNSNFYADPVLRAVTSTVTPQSAIINS